MEKQSTRKFLKLIVALVALFLLGASALMLASCNKDEHQHSYTSSVTTPATCSNPGVETFTCSCGYAYTQIIPATGDHDWQVLQVYPNSCESDGYTVYECSVCHEQKQGDWTAKRDHKYEAVETVEATCTTDGYQIMQCSYCGDRYTDDQYSSEHKATGHKWIVNDDTDADGWKEVKAANCLEANVKERTCERCGLVENKSDVEALGHHVEGMSETVDLAAALKAKNLYVCAESDLYVDVDGNKYAFECDREDCPVEVVIDEFDNTAHYIAATAHTMKASTNAEDGYVAATCDLGGVDVQKCEVCGHTEKTDTAALGHNWNTVRMDGKTPVVVCEADTGLTQTAYLNAMKNALGVQKYAEMATTLVNNYAEATSGGKGVSRYCARCGELTVANGHEYVISKLEDGKFGLNDYEKNEDGTPVVAEGVTVETMDCRYVQVCKNGCGTVLARGQHGAATAATCRDGGYCEVCGEQVSAQLDHAYVNVSDILTYANSTDADEKALYDAYVKVSATETWMKPVEGSCNTPSTAVQVCSKCLLDAANGAEFTWNTSSTSLDASNPNPVYNASVVETAATHDYQATYFRLNATDLSSPIVYEQTNCEFGYKVAYICADCGEVYKNVPVGNDPATEDTNEAANNKVGAYGYTDSIGFVLDVTGKTMTNISAEDVAKLQAEDHIGIHSLYVIPEYAKTNGYVAPTCVSKAIIPYVCEHCGATIAIEYGVVDADRYTIATGVAGAGTVAETDQKVNPANHAGTPYDCGVHCDYHDGDVYCAKVADDNLTAADASAHATVNVTYKFSTSVTYYNDYTLKIASLPAEAITEGATIDWTKATLSDTTKVSKCQNNSTYTMPKEVATSGNVAGDYLVLVAEDGTAYGLNAFDLYTEDATTPGNAVTDSTTVNQDDVFFVRVKNDGSATAAPVAAVDEPSLKMAFNGTPVEQADGTKLLNVTVSENISVESLPAFNEEADEVVVDLGGHKLTAEKAYSVNGDVTYSNGSIEITEPAGAAAAFQANVGCDVTFDNVEFKGSGLLLMTTGYAGTGTQSAVFTIKDSTLVCTGNYGVSTNASSADQEQAPVKLIIENSSITMNPDNLDTTAATDNTALFINVPATVKVTGSTLNANRQVVVVRGGTLEMSNTTLNLKGEFKQYEVVASGAGADQYNFSSLGDTSIATIKAFAEGLTLQDYRMSGLWGTGNEVPYGAIVMGNSSKTSYQYATNVTLASDVVFNIDNGDAKKIVIGSYYDTAIAGDAASPKIAVTLRAVGLGLGVNDVEVCWNHLDSTISFFGVDGYPAVY